MGGLGKSKEPPEGESKPMAAAREGQAGPPSSFIFHGRVHQLLSLSNQGRRGGREGIREGERGN